MYRSVAIIALCRDKLHIMLVVLCVFWRVHVVFPPTACCVLASAAQCFSAGRCKIRQCLAYVLSESAPDIHLIIYVYILLQAGNLAIAEELCSRGARLNTNTFSIVEFLIAAAESFTKLRLVCGKAGIDINTSDVDGRTALHHAASSRRWRVAQNLLDAGAEVGAADRYAAHKVATPIATQGPRCTSVLTLPAVCVSERPPRRDGSVRSC